MGSRKRTYVKLLVCSLTLPLCLSPSLPLPCLPSSSSINISDLIHVHERPRGGAQRHDPSMVARSTVLERAGACWVHTPQRCLRLLPKPLRARCCLPHGIRLHGIAQASHRQIVCICGLRMPNPAGSSRRSGGQCVCIHSHACPTTQISIVVYHEQLYSHMQIIRIFVFVVYHQQL